MRDYRLRSLQLLFGGLAFVLLLRLFDVQVLQNRRFKAMASSQHFGERLIPARRGSIFSRDGFPLVTNRTAYLLAADIPKVTDPTGLAKNLADLLFDPDSYSEAERRRGLGNLKKDFEFSLEEKVTTKDLVWTVLARKLDPSKKERIDQLGFEGLSFDEEPVRYYPEVNLASFVLGFVGWGERGEQGYYGIEGFYDGDLRGKSGRLIEERSAAGLPILAGDYHEVRVSDGRDLILTLDRSIQYLVEKRLKDGIDRFGAKSGTVIILDPATGAVISMASYPNFDNGDWERFARTYEGAISDRNLIFRNPAISETYEPGSVLKALTISTAIDLELVEPQSEFDDNGPIVASGHLVDNWDKRHHGRQNIIQLLQKSNNVGAAYVGKKVGAEKLRTYFLRFGLGSPMGIDLTGEDTGTIKDLSQWREIDLVTAAFGQGISVTPIQLVSDFAAIANGGTLYKPFVVSEIRDGDQSMTFKPVKLRQVLSPEKSAVMIELLTAAAEGGEGKFFVLKKYHVAGKTGTAQIPVDGQYDPEKTNTTFVGFLPGSLKFVMLVRLREPSSSIYAAETAVPLWMEITKDLVGLLAIPPDR